MLKGNRNKSRFFFLKKRWIFLTLFILGASHKDDDELKGSQVIYFNRQLRSKPVVLAS